ncbi:MAG: S-methyl-5'-thioinosine phosphorylase [Arenicellales bacterium WSBS_2016_MAG_OTU3]
MQIGILGGSGLAKLEGFEVLHKEVVRTPYGEPSGPLLRGRFAGEEIVFLPRHGAGHTIPPHVVNYRANIWALKQTEVDAVVAVAAVGAIKEYAVSSLVLPDQLLDYTHGREHTFFDGRVDRVEHIDFSYPYDEVVRSILKQAADRHGIMLPDKAVYAVAQGPRLETTAEVDRMERDGACLIGMTGMPEAALAREAELRYACLSLIVNPAAGRAKIGQVISFEEILAALAAGVSNAVDLLKVAVPMMAAA